MRQENFSQQETSARGVFFKNMRQDATAVHTGINGKAPYNCMVVHAKRACQLLNFQEEKGLEMCSESLETHKILYVAALI